MVVFAAAVGLLAERLTGKSGGSLKAYTVLLGLCSATAIVVGGV